MCIRDRSNTGSRRPLSFMGTKADYYRSGKLKRIRFPVIVLKPASIAAGSDGSFMFAACTRKNVRFAHSTSPLPRFLASQNTGCHQTWRTHAPLWLESSLSTRKLIQKWVRPPRLKRDLGTQTTYDPQTWRRGLYVQWSIRPPSLVMIRGL